MPAWNDLGYSVKRCELWISHSASPSLTIPYVKGSSFLATLSDLTVFHSNVSLVKTSSACISNAWLNICSACKAERKYHTVNCLHIHTCGFHSFMFNTLSKTNFSQVYYLSWYKMKLCKILAKIINSNVTISKLYSNYKSYLDSLNNGQMHNDHIIEFLTKLK